MAGQTEKQQRNRVADQAENICQPSVSEAEPGHYRNANKYRRILQETVHRLEDTDPALSGGIGEIESQIVLDESGESMVPCEPEKDRQGDYCCTDQEIQNHCSQIIRITPIPAFIILSCVVRFIRSSFCKRSPLYAVEDYTKTHHNPEAGHVDTDQADCREGCSADDQIHACDAVCQEVLQKTEESNHQKRKGVFLFNVSAVKEKGSQ